MVGVQINPVSGMPPVLHVTFCLLVHLFKHLRFYEYLKMVCHPYFEGFAEIRAGTC